MRRNTLVLAAFVAILLFGASCSGSQPEPTPVRPTKTPKPTFTPTTVPPTLEIRPIATAEAPTAVPQPTEAPTAAPTQPPTPTTPPEAQLSASQSVNVRRGPGTNYPVVGKLAAGEGGKVTGKNADGSWFQFTFNGAAVWVTAELVTISGDSEGIEVAQNIPAPPPPPPTARPQPTAAPQPTSPPAPSHNWNLVTKGNPGPQCGVVHFKGQVQFANGSPRNGVYVLLDYYGPRTVKFSGGGGAGAGNFEFAPCAGNQACKGTFNIYVVQRPGNVPDAGLTLDPAGASPANDNSDVFEVNITDKCQTGQWEGIVFKSKD